MGINFRVMTTELDTMPDKTSDGPDSDPSFIRTNASELFNFARRLGMSNDQVREAVDSGLIKPAANSRVGSATKSPEAPIGTRERPDGF